MQPSTFYHIYNHANDPARDRELEKKSRPQSVGGGCSFVGDNLSKKMSHENSSGRLESNRIAVSNSQEQRD